jgi:hypothetical protein
MKKMFDNCKSTGYPALTGAKSPVGFSDSNETKADSRHQTSCLMAFFMSVPQLCSFIWAGLGGRSFDLPGAFVPGSLTRSTLPILRLAMQWVVNIHPNEGASK